MRALNISDTGRFRFDGRTKDTNIPITIKGKFVTPRKTVGTIEMQCDGTDIEDEFVAKRQTS